MKRRCSGCGQRKHCEIPIGGNLVCDSCGPTFGIGGGRLRNVAEANSKEWKKKPCHHQSVNRVNYSKGRQNWCRAVCQRCHAVVWDIKV
jgi:hypothetical protein